MADTKLIGLTPITTPVDADLLYVVTDVSTTPASKKITWGNIIATLEAYFDTIYATATAYVPYTGATTAVNLGSNNLTAGATSAESLEVTTDGEGVTMTSPDGLTTKTISIDNSGNLIIT